MNTNDTRTHVPYMLGSAIRKTTQQFVCDPVCNVLYLPPSI